MGKTKSKQKTGIGQLNLLTQEAIKHPSAVSLLAPAAAQPGHSSDPASNEEGVAPYRGAFGAWLVQQHLHRREWVAGLARAAKSDPRFPKIGSADDVREYLTRHGADGDAFEALDDAEADWLMC